MPFVHATNVFKQIDCTQQYPTGFRMQEDYSRQEYDNEGGDLKSRNESCALDSNTDRPQQQPLGDERAMKEGLSRKCKMGRRTSIFFIFLGFTVSIVAYSSLPFEPQTAKKVQMIIQQKSVADIPTSQVDQPVIVQNQLQRTSPKKQVLSVSQVSEIQSESQEISSMQTANIQYEEILRQDQQEALQKLYHQKFKETSYRQRLLDMKITFEQFRVARNYYFQSRSRIDYKQFATEIGAQNEKKYYENKYQIGSYEEKPICVIVPSYNNAANDRCKHNLASILQQDYQNYHIVFIDDGSTDGTKEIVEQFLKENEVPSTKYQIIRNNINLKAMTNIQNAAFNYCQPEEIIIIVDGDDELIGWNVFKLENAIYSKNDVWFVYTNFFDSRLKKKGYSKIYHPNVINANEFRSLPFGINHLRSFYTELFRRIKDEDLRDSFGNYYQAANDAAMCLPMIQMSQKHFSVVQELTYIYNSNTGRNNHVRRPRVQQENFREVQKKQKYTPLLQLFDND